MRPATKVSLSSDDRGTLERWIKSGTSESRLVLRGRIVLAASSGTSTQEVARKLSIRPATVSKWRGRFAREGLAGLQDAPRPGAQRRYGWETEKQIFRKLDQPPPEGFASWNGALLAKALKDVSDDQVWRVLRRHGICLQRRQSWCISTDPEFAPKAADIVGLYLAPPENAVVLSVDEKPSIQALERAQGYLRLPNGRALTGFSHEYTRHGTTTLFAALEVATGLVRAGHYQRRRRREFLDFMNEVVASYPKTTQIHVVLDNLSSHKPKHDRWLTRHPNVHFHFTPTHASWLNQIECWFSILSRAALRGASFTSPRQVRTAIDRFIAAYNQTAEPFAWKKAKVHPVTPTRTYANLRK